ncbi:MAG: hypothetical protein A2252_07575 [Elusimicrobia bacterium RIFOXYA2_FULL_39_19]|nr:MAG: hypothetical protein A2252_07575 [Elusimicrobia bacterium RIFOXYA2_FULL_39_19]
MKLAFFDVETTGLSPSNGDRICEVGILCTDDFIIKKRYSTLINPSMPINPSASMINGITDEMVADAPKFSQVADKILKHFSDRIIVCHNVPFDFKFLRHELAMMSLPMPDNPVMDTLKIARKFFNFPSNKLQSIADLLNITPKEKHRALADVYTTKEVLKYFFEQFDRRGIDIMDHYYQ